LRLGDPNLNMNQSIRMVMLQLTHLGSWVAYQPCGVHELGKVISATRFDMMNEWRVILGTTVYHKCISYICKVWYTIMIMLMYVHRCIHHSWRNRWMNMGK